MIWSWVRQGQDKGIIKHYTRSWGLSFPSDLSLVLGFGTYDLGLTVQIILTEVLLNVICYVSIVLIKELVTCRAIWLIHSFFFCTYTAKVKFCESMIFAFASFWLEYSHHKLLRIFLSFDFSELIYVNDTFPLTLEITPSNWKIHEIYYNSK